MSEPGLNVYAAPEAESAVSPPPGSRAWRRFVRHWPSIAAATLVGAALLGSILFFGELARTPSGMSNVTDALKAQTEAVKQHAPPEEVARLNRQVRTAIVQEGSLFFETFRLTVLREFGTQLVINIYALFVLFLVLGRERRRPATMLGPGRIARLVLLSGLLAMLEVAGDYACVVPGLIIGIFDMFAPFLVILEDAGAIRSVGRSFALTWRGGLPVISIGAATTVLGFVEFFALSRLFAGQPGWQAICFAAVDVVELPLLTLLWLSFWEDAVEREARPPSVRGA